MVGSKMEGAHIIEVNDLVISMTSKLKCECFGEIKDVSTEFPPLHKMRRMLCDAESDVYEPSIISIGPYHHNCEGTVAMEQTKWESLYYILGLNPEKKMRDYLEAIAGLEQQIRSCYANTVVIDSDDLLKMILLDACFMFCILCGTEGAPRPIPKSSMLNTDDGKQGPVQYTPTPATSSNVDGTQKTSPQSLDIIDSDETTYNTYSSRQWYSSYFAHDLLLLENQIPFYAIIKIYELVTNGNSPTTVLLENVARFVEDLILSYPKAVLKFDHPKEVHHLLYLCHQYFKPTQIKAITKLNLVAGTSGITGPQLLGWHQASEYHKAGIKLKKREICPENPQSLLDIQFYEGVMDIPCLTIDPNTYCLFRNLLAFEETCPQFGNYITAYVVFLSQFISTPVDVCLITKQGIIAHQLDSDAEVSNLFKMLAEGVTFDINSEHYLKHVCYEMEVHYQMQRPKWRKWFCSIGSKLPSSPKESKPNEYCTRGSPDECV